MNAEAATRGGPRSFVAPLLRMTMEGRFGPRLSKGGRRHNRAITMS